MNRVSSRASSPPTSLASQKQQRNSQSVGSEMGGVFRILGVFMINKRKSEMKIFWKKCKQWGNYKKKRSTSLCLLMKNLFQRKVKGYLMWTFNKLGYHRDQAIKQEYQQMQAIKLKVKNKSIAILGILWNQLYFQHLKSVFQSLINESKFRYKLQNYKRKYFCRVFNTLTNSKIKIGFDAIKKKKVQYIKVKNVFKRLQKFMLIKKQYHLSQVLFKLQVGLPMKQQATKTPQTSVKNSRLKPANYKLSPQLPQQTSTAQKTLQQKNKKIEDQISVYKIQNEKKISQYKKQLTQHQAQCQQLKFYIDILDGNIQQLETEILNRQKKSIKTLSSVQLWDRVYSNFLFLLTKHSGQILSKQKVLEYLQYPLTPLNLPIQTIRSENQLLAQLLQEYKKFFKDVPSAENSSSQNMLPYDIIVSRNKFFYSTIQVLIRQGIGNEQQTKQLQIQLQNIIKQS